MEGIICLLNKRIELRREAIQFSSLTNCVKCKAALVRTTGKGFSHVVDVWNGSSWSRVKHGTELCTKCQSRYKLSYIAEVGAKLPCIQDVNKNSTILIHPELGFYNEYLHQYWNRACRSAVSSQGEAAAILLTFPNGKSGYPNKVFTRTGNEVLERALAHRLV